MGALVGGQAVTTYEDEDGDAVDVRVRLPEKLRQDPSQVEKLRLARQRPAGPPVLVPLGNLVRYEMSTTPSEINRQDLTRQVVISANLDGLPLGTAVSKVQKAAEKIQMAPGYRIVFSGEAEDMAESFGYMAEALVLAIILVYLILAAQFESFIDPLAIMFSLPLSIVGMAGMLFLTGDTVNMMSLIGLIMLMGLVTKNAILLVDFTKTLALPGDGPPGGPDHRRADQAAADPDDHPGHDLRNAAPGPGPRAGGRDAGPHGPGRHRGPDHLHPADPAGGSRRLYVAR